MAKIALNTDKLPIPQKLAKGQQIITMSTNNANVPGNAALLAALTAAQADLAAKQMAADEARKAAAEAFAARDASLALWQVAAQNLAGLTQTATGGVESKILSAGFDVRSQPVPPVPVAQVEHLMVALSDRPGYSDLDWKADTNADAYAVQSSPDPMTDTSWGMPEMVVGVKVTVNGATPGQKRWYRVAAVNRLGQGPWSEPVPRPLM